MSKKYIEVLVGFAVVSGLFFNAGVSRGDTNASIAYLKSKPLTAWTIMALVAAGESPSLETLKTVTSDKAIDFEAPILALTAAGKDPRNFGSVDLVAKLKSFSDGAQLGDATILNDDVFGILALLSAGESRESTAVSSTLRFVKARQNGDGGWGYAVGGTSDTNTTAAAVMALRAAEVPANDASLTKAIDYLKAAQNGDGGFPYDPKSAWGTDSDASSDAWSIMAIKSAGQDPAAWQKDGKSPANHLQTLRAESGAFTYQPGAGEDAFTPTTTSYAVIALANKFFPLRVISPAAPVPVHYSYRIEGATQELCAGEADGVNAIESVKSAAAACGITYHIQESSLGSYVDEIATEKAAGSKGWLYFINNELASVGADAYRLKSADEILWYFGEYGALPTRITLATTTIAGGSNAEGTVESYKNGAWSALQEAVVKSGHSSTTTGSDGKFSLSLNPGIRKIYAEKTGFVRGAEIKVTVGSLSSTTLDLEVDIPASTSTNSGSGGGGNGGGGGNPASGEVSFVVETGTSAKSLDFGKLDKGKQQKKKITLQNKGQGTLSIESAVTGDDLFKSYLLLDGKTWRLFQNSVTAGASITPEVRIDIPQNYSGSGVKKGALTFWATQIQ